MKVFISSYTDSDGGVITVGTAPLSHVAEIVRRAGKQITVNDDKGGSLVVEANEIYPLKTISQKKFESVGDVDIAIRNAVFAYRLVSMARIWLN